MPRMTFTITLDEQGVISLNGPIDHPLECYGLLELARQAVADYQRQKAAKAPAIQLAPAMSGLKS